MSTQNPGHVTGAMTGPHAERGAGRVATAPKSEASSQIVTPPGSGDDTTNRKNMMLLVQLRWIAVIGQIITIVAVQFGLGIQLPLRPMAAVLGAVVLLNLICFAWLQNRTAVSKHSLLMVLILDVIALTAQLYLSGGATNPFIFLYLLQVTLAAVLLDAGSIWAVAAISCACFAGVTVYYRPLMLPAGTAGSLFRLHITGTLMCFALDAALLVVFVIRVMRNLRERDTRLAALKQHATEEDLIVRMGLLASGAAHELGTPLSLLSVILNDWRHMPALSSSPEMLQDIEEMQTSVRRCKSIVTGILMSSGEARGEAPKVTMVKTFLDELVAEWRASRAATTLDYRNAFGDDLPIVSDSALKQVLFNVLDNAFEVSPARVGFEAEREGGTLVLRVSDDGPGFAAEMLEQFGKPYQSSKGRKGGGLGLFLVVNVLRKLGGVVAARNRKEGGAVVTIALPLVALRVGVRAHGK
jgi:two-component system, sensor histidine kinase RegB